jgi:hypothetical protein
VVRSDPAVTTMLAMAVNSPTPAPKRIAVAFLGS